METELLCELVNVVCSVCKRGKVESEFCTAARILQRLMQNVNHVLKCSF